MPIVNIDIPVSRFMPDQSDYNPRASGAIFNVQPKAQGWGPLNDFATLGSGLGAACRGGLTVNLQGGTKDMYAGTAADLLKFDPSDSSWSSVKGEVYSVPDGRNWSMVQYGTHLIAVNGDDDNQYIEIEAGTTFGDLPNAPKAFRAGVSGDFLFMLGLASNRRQLAWSGVNDFDHWTFREKLSDYQELPKGGDIQGFVGYENGGFVFMERAVYKMIRVPTDSVFNFDEHLKHIGLFAPDSLVEVNNTFFWYDQSGFYGGADAINIGAEKVNDYIRRIADAEKRSKMVGCYDPRTKIIWWLFNLDSGGQLMLGYDHILKEWTQANMMVDYIFPVVAPGYTYETWGDLFATYGDLPNISYDSSFWDGSRVELMGGFNSSGDFGYFESTPLEAILETHDIRASSGRATKLNRIRPISDAPYGSYNVEIGTRKFEGDPILWHDPITPNQKSGWMISRKRGASHRAKITIDAGTDWHNFLGFATKPRGAGKRL